MSLFEHPEFEHETVTFGADSRTGLRAIIAVHNTSRGPAIGGCRMMPYPDEASALTDVLRLSKGMTYKCAIGDIPFGGGKAVIHGDPATDKTTELLHAMGDFVDRLGGRYITSFDAGTNLDDVATMGERTQHVGGIQPGAGNASASTAMGVYLCMRKAAELRLNKGSLEGLRVAIQGAGNVGSRLAKLVADDGAQVIVADVNTALAAQIANTMGGKTCDPQEVLSSDCDVFAPCALGGVLSKQTVRQLRCSIVCGGANNQLVTDANANELAARDIFYCPDYLANAGGIIDLHYQLNEPSRERLGNHLEQLGITLADCHVYSQQHDCSMAQAANRVAETRFK